MPNAKVLKEKQQIVKNLTDRIGAAKAGVLVDYRGLTVEAVTKLRNNLRVAEVEYSVEKNTMIRRAVAGTDLEEMDPFLNGPTAIATSEDLIASAKTLVEFAKTNDKLEIKVGFIEGKMISKEEVAALAELPSKEVLIARVLGGLNAPISGFANVLNANLTGLVRVLDAISKKSA